MKSFTWRSLACTALACGLMTGAWAQKTPANPVTEAQLRDTMAREMAAAVAGLIQSCQQRHPDKSAALDAVWASEVASAPAGTQAYMKTPEFAQAVATYKKAQLAQTNNAAGAQSHTDLCLKLAQSGQ